ncbi:MAG TPA: AAA family ATPase, partial [Thermomicrobiales bacterium]|nr:AAA family ATPase [Thermomicrobiales bacterium]
MTGTLPLDRAIRRAKLRPPPLRGDLVARRHLTARLGDPPRPTLTLVVAPAGFGKTTLLAEWAARAAVSTAWLTVDADDRVLPRFVAAVVAAIGAAAPGVGAPALDLLRRPEPLPAADIGAALADELLALPETVVLVIDDYHLAASTDVERCLDGLLRYAPLSFRLVLSSRVEPGLPLARMRLHGDVAEFRASDLRFTDDDVRALLAGRGMADVDAALIATIQRQIDGWIAGLQLAVLALPTLADPTRLAEAIAGEQSLLDFLVDEVLTTQSAATQDFVLQMAIPDEICAPLADALSDPPPDPENERRLRSLAHDHFFLEPADDSGWFRYHPLFRSLLLHRLESGFPRSRVAELRRRAGAWFAAQGRLDEALPLLLAAGAGPEAARLVEAAVHQALNREAWQSLNRWLRLLPAETIEASPRLLLATGWVAHLSGRAIPLRAMLAKAEALLARSDAPVVAALRAEIDLLGMGTFMPIEQDPERSLTVLRRVMKRLPADHRFPIGLAHVGLAYALQTTGRSEEAIGGLVAMAERESDAIDAGSIRAWFGMLFVLRQAGDFPA